MAWAWAAGSALGGAGVTTGSVLSAVGTGVAVYGQIQSSQAASSAADFQGKLNDRNATIDKQNAEQAQNDALRAARYQSREDRRLRAAQRAAYAASGVEVDTGTPSVVAEKTRENQAQGLQEIMRQGSFASRNYLTRASSFSAQAASDRSSASQYRTAGNIGVASSLISGYADYRKGRSQVQSSGY